VRRLLADVNVNVNWANPDKVRVGGAARAGGDSGQRGRRVRCRAQCVSRRRVAGARISREASVRVESCTPAYA
jgi:hypothetical protein